MNPGRTKGAYSGKKKKLTGKTKIRRGSFPWQLQKPNKKNSN